MRSLRGILPWALLLAIPGAGVPQETHLDVPYVPTRPEVVAKMLQLANPGPKDVLYDLGCGDGRIVVTAAKEFGTRGVGIDINPERIKESRENAARENVSHLVMFHVQDLFKTDFHEASVVTLYLLSSVNLRLRPILFSQLRPGTRIVSHDFSMGDWRPDEQAEVNTDGMTHEVYFWVLPANFSGTWQGAWPFGTGKERFVLDIQQKFQIPEGRLKVGENEMVLSEAAIKGDRITFGVQLASGGKSTGYVFEGRVSRNGLEGTVETRGGAPGQKAWKAAREVGTERAIDVGNERY
jgi:SAM-dependent methyltransferase